MQYYVRSALGKVAHKYLRDFKTKGKNPAVSAET